MIIPHKIWIFFYDFNSSSINVKFLEKLSIYHLSYPIYNFAKTIFIKFLYAINLLNRKKNFKFIYNKY